MSQHLPSVYGWSLLRWPRPLLVWIFKYHAVWIEIAGVLSNSKKYLNQLTISKCVQNTSFSSSLWNEDIIVHLIHSSFMMKRLDGNSFCNFSRLPSWMCVRICFFFSFNFCIKSGNNMLWSFKRCLTICGMVRQLYMKLITCSDNISYYDPLKKNSQPIMCYGLTGYIVVWREIVGARNVLLLFDLDDYRIWVWNMESKRLY